MDRKGVGRMVGAHTDNGLLPVATTTWMSVIGLNLLNNYVGRLCVGGRVTGVDACVIFSGKRSITFETLLCLRDSERR